MIRVERRQLEADRDRPFSRARARADVGQPEQHSHQPLADRLEIGAARALYFPQLSLSAFIGGQSRSLLQLASAPARVYTVAPSALQTIFHAGQTRNQVRFSEAQQREITEILTGLRSASGDFVQE